MTKSDIFLDYVSKILKKHLESDAFSELERMSIRLCVYDIFQKHYDMEEIYYDLLDFVEKDEKLASLTTKIEMYYLTSSN